MLGRFAIGTGAPFFTGEGSWEGFATGIGYDVPTGGPPLDSINAQIAVANAAAGAPGTTSIGWVDAAGATDREGVLVFGEDNTTPSDGSCDNPFPIVCASERS